MNDIFVTPTSRLLIAAGVGSDTGSTYVSPGMIFYESHIIALFPCQNTLSNSGIQSVEVALTATELRRQCFKFNYTEIIDPFIRSEAFCL